MFKKILILALMMAFSAPVFAANDEYDPATGFPKNYEKDLADHREGIKKQAEEAAKFMTLVLQQANLEGWKVLVLDSGSFTLDPGYIWLRIVVPAKDVKAAMENKFEGVRTVGKSSAVRLAHWMTEHGWDASDLAPYEDGKPSVNVVVSFWHTKDKRFVHFGYAYYEPKVGNAIWSRDSSPTWAKNW
ncbi:MAG: hypothetical protein FWD79_09345 [Desulfobulbus sp.]|nr:hypothetical protein [Desulfobulbus sp.]